MKFRTIFFLFNLIILLSFGFIFLMPLPILGWSYAVSFWSQNWAIALVFVAVLAALDGYFVAHWRLYSLLEREDWSGLKVFLESQLQSKGSLGLAQSRIYINACLIGQAPGKINELRALYQAKKVGYLPQLVLSLGLPLVLEGNSQAIQDFMGPYAENRRTGADRPWILWSLAFGGLLGDKRDESAAALQKLLSGRCDALLELLGLYLLDSLRGSDPSRDADLDARRLRLSARYTEKEWTTHIDKLKETVILVLFMGKLIQDARSWLSSPVPGGTS